MACNLTAGRLVDCKDQIGGLKTIYFAKSYCANIETVDTLTADSFIMTSGGFATWDIASGSTTTVYQYDLRPNLSSMTINVNSDPSTGTTFFTQTLSITLQKLDAATSYQLRLLAYNRAQAFVLDSNDNLYLLGYNNGLDVTGGTIVSGAGKGDMSGYTLEFSAEEKIPLIHISQATLGTGDWPFSGLGDVSADNSILDIVVGS